MKIYFATTNKSKVDYLQHDLKDHGIDVVQKSIDLSEPRSSDVQEIAGAKIREAYSNIKKPTVVIDAGFYIHSLNGFPRAFVNFALETVGTEGILQLTEHKPRGCEFRECLAYMDSKLKEPKYFLLHITGKLSEAPQGLMQPHLWSKLGLIFVPDGAAKTLGEMSLKDYIQWRSNSQEKNSLGKQLYAWMNTRKD